MVKIDVDKSRNVFNPKMVVNFNFNVMVNFDEAVFCTLSNFLYTFVEDIKMLLFEFV